MSELPAGQETFISHLVELRDHLVKGLIRIALAFTALKLWPGPAQIYDVPSTSMVSSLSAGAKMIATGVTSPFLVPMKVTLLLAFILGLPWVFFQI